MEKLYTVSKKKTTTTTTTHMEADHELLIEKFIFKLKKVEKATRPLRYMT